MTETQSFCWATHPDKPNHNGHARGRGRKLHLTNGEKLTKCNMLIDKIEDKPHIIEARISRGKLCKVCFKEES